MKTLPLILLTLLLTSCAPKSFNESSIPYTSKNGGSSEAICAHRFEMEVYQMSRNQEQCFNEAYESKSLLGKIFDSEESYNCPMEKFYHSQEVKRIVSECQNHMENPQFKVGQQVSIVNESFDPSCRGVILRADYSSGSVATPIYQVKISCGGSVRRSDTLAESSLLATNIQ